MEPTDITLSAVAVAATVGVCLVARTSAAARALIQVLAGFVTPVIVFGGAFVYWGSIRGSHSSLGMLAIAWFLCMVIGLLFSRRSAT